MNIELKQLLAKIHDRPLLVGGPSLRRLLDFVYGYQYCMIVRDGNNQENYAFPMYMQDFVCEYYNVRNITSIDKYFWGDIIVFCEHSEEKAFYKLYELLELYEKKYGSKEESDS